MRPEKGRAKMPSHDKDPDASRETPDSQSEPTPAEGRSAAPNDESGPAKSGSNSDSADSSPENPHSGPLPEELSPSDRKLISDLNGGRDSGLVEVDRRFRQRLLNFVKRSIDRSVLRGAAPEDFVHSAEGSLWRGITKGKKDGKKLHFEHPAAVWNWLRTVALNKIRKRAAKRREDLLPPGVEPVAEAEAEIASSVIQEVVDGLKPSDLDKMVELLRRLGYSLEEIREKAIENLNPPGPDIFELKLTGESRAAIAEKLGCTVARVRTNLERMLERLKKWLAADLRG